MAVSCDLFCVGENALGVDGLGIFNIYWVRQELGIQEAVWSNERL